jgi:hypothetical protein
MAVAIDTTMPMAVILSLVALYNSVYNILVLNGVGILRYVEWLGILLAKGHVLSHSHALNYGKVTWVGISRPITSVRNLTTIS